MKKILFFLFIIILSLFFLIFHDKGNQILKPYVSSYLEDKLNQNISVELEHLKLDLNYIELSVILNKVTKINAKGNLSLFSQKLNIEYTLKSNDFKNKIDINGTITGTFKNMKVQGEGETLKSYIHYALNIKDDVLENIKMNINKADITSLLQLLSQPNYAQGKVNINIDIPSLTQLDNKGKIKIVLHPTTLNEEVFKKEFKIDLAKKTLVTANINSNVNSKVFELEGEVKSDFALLELSNTTYDINAKEFLLNYVLSTPELSKLMFLTQKKLNGKLKINGEIKLKNEKINITGASKSLGGETNFNYDGKSLNTFMNNIEINKLLHLLNEKTYATGELEANIKLSNLKELEGIFEVKTKNAKTINYILKKELDLNFRRPISFSLTSKGSIASDIISSQSMLTSEILTYKSDKLKYNLNTSSLTSNYQLNIPRLSKFNTLVNKPLKGQLLMDGEINFDNHLIVTGSTESLDGDIYFELVDKKLNTKINNVSAEKLMYVLSYPQVFTANILGNFDYHFTSRQGKFTSTLNKAKLLSSDLTVAIEQLRGIDLTKERYNKTHFNATLSKDLIDIDFEASNNNVLLSIPSGQINKANKSIDATFNISVKDKDIAGKIKGNISSPEIIINSSKFIKDEMQGIIQNNMLDQPFNELGFGKKETEIMRDMMDSFF